MRLPEMASLFPTNCMIAQQPVSTIAMVGVVMEFWLLPSLVDIIAVNSLGLMLTPLAWPVVWVWPIVWEGPLVWPCPVPAVATELDSDFARTEEMRLRSAFGSKPRHSIRNGTQTYNRQEYDNNTMSIPPH